MANDRYKDLSNRLLPQRGVLDKLQDSAEMSSRPIAGRDIAVSISSAGIEVNSTLPPRFQARITAKSSSTPPKYSWIEVGRNESGSTYEHPNPRRGTAESWPAYERSGSEDVTLGSFIAELVQGNGEWYEFSLGTGGGGGTGVFQNAVVYGDPIGVVVAEGSSVVIPWQPGTVSQYFTTGNNQFARPGGVDLDFGYYHLTGTVEFESTDCLYVYGCEWAAVTATGTRSVSRGTVTPGASNGGPVYVTCSTHFWLRDDASLPKYKSFKFYGWHTNTEAPSTAYGKTFGITLFGSGEE